MSHSGKRMRLVPLTAGLAAALLLLAAVPAQARFTCGGSRAGTCTMSIVATGQLVQTTLIGSTVAEVSVTNPTTLSALWVSGRLYGTIQGIGDVELSVAGTPASVASIVSDSPSGNPFFPALASQQLYWTIAVLDAHGNVVQQLVNRTAMDMQATVQQIPPLGTPFPVAGDVSFYDSSSGALVLVLKASGSSGTLNTPGGLQVSLVSKTIDTGGGTFQSQWSIQNLTSAPLTINWFATGIHSASISSPAEGRNVVLGAKGGPASSITVSLAGTFNPGNPDAGLAVHATSAPGQAVAEDHSLLYFLQ